MTLRGSSRALPALGLVFATACAPADPGVRGRDGEPPIARVAASAEGMVVSGSAPATRVGAGILAAGGNAADAAIATAFALAVTEPTQSGLGGRTQALVHGPRGPAFGVDATTEVPARYDPETATPAEDGYGTVAIPGTVAGLARVHAEAGALSWAQLIEPSIHLAEDGFVLSEGEARRLAGIRERLLLSEGARSAFLRPGGAAHAAGDVMRQPDLARVLRVLRDEGPEAFYRGGIAEEMARDLEAHGWVTAEDLAAYRAEPSILVRGSFGGLELVGTYLPASGATVIEAAQILDRVGLSGMGPDLRALTVGRALLMAFEDREAARADARPAAADAAWITSDELASERARALSRGAAPRSGLDALEPEHTSHISVVDRDGMSVAMTQSLGPTGGARVATPGLGFLYAATLGGYLGRVEPGERPWSSQSPLIALRGGRPALVMGGGGSRRIISAMVETLVRVEVEGRTIEEAVAAPRLHPSATWVFERATPSDTLPPGAWLARERGYPVRADSAGVFFARLNVIGIAGAERIATGVADPRWPWGAASGPRPYAPAGGRRR